jgi:hypothetical protein
MKPIISTSADGTETKYASIAEAARAGFDRSAISKCLAELRKTHRGYRWRYGESSPDISAKFGIVAIEVRPDTWDRHIYFANMSDVAAAGYCRQAVLACLDGLCRRTHHGLIWQRATVYESLWEFAKDRPRSSVESRRTIIADLLTLNPGSRDRFDLGEADRVLCN